MAQQAQLKTDSLSSRARPRLRILLGKPGLDGHDIGFKVVASALRDAGFEVVLGGIYLAPEEIVEMAVQESADVVGLNVMSGCHMTAVPEVLAGLKAKGLELPVIVGGIVPPADVAALREQGIAAYFGPGTPMKEIVAFMNRIAESKKAI
ncbi:MAG: cobalamin B12-binding domain-containing protein [Candidatus Binataceae bacterium]|jgi:methylmalonyl-CoA mutase C-terminal domain/subunit